MTFLNIVGVTEMLCSFKLELEGKTGKEILGHENGVIRGKKRFVKL